MSVLTKSEEELGILAEIGNIGLGHSVTSLSILLKQRTNMAVVKTDIRHISELPELLGDVEKGVEMINVQITGELSGSILTILDSNSADNLVEEVLKDIECDTPGSTLKNSVLQEASNILVGSYVGAIDEFTNLKTSVNVPERIVDMAGAILSELAIMYADSEDEVILICTEFADSEVGINGKFIIVLEENSYATLMSSMKK